MKKVISCGVLVPYAYFDVITKTALCPDNVVGIQTRKRHVLSIAWAYFGVGGCFHHALYVKLFVRHLGTRGRSENSK